MEGPMNRQEEIARIAYELYQKRGCIGGREIDDWCEAEQIVTAKYLTIEALTIGVVPAGTDGRSHPAGPRRKAPEKKTAPALKPARKAAAAKASAPKRKKA